MVKIKYRFGKPTKVTVVLLIKEYNDLHDETLINFQNFYFSILWNKDGGQGLKIVNSEYENLLLDFCKFIKEKYNLETTFNSKGLGKDYFGEIFFLKKIK